MIQEKDYIELRDIIENDYGVHLSINEVRLLGDRLISLFELLMPDKHQNIYENDRLQTIPSE